MSTNLLRLILCCVTCFILYHVLTILKTFDRLVGFLVMRDAHMEKEGGMWHLIVFKRDFLVCTSLGVPHICRESMTVACMGMISNDT